MTDIETSSSHGELDVSDSIPWWDGFPGFDRRARPGGRGDQESM